MLKKQIIIFIFISQLIIDFVYSQENQYFDEQQFFKQMQTSYYALTETNINNFTVLLTNIRTEKFAQDKWNNNEIFPIQMIWLASDRIFLSEQGVPALDDSAKKIYSELVGDLKKQVSGVLFDLKRFYLNGVFKSISNDYQLRQINDLIEIKFTQMNQEDSTYFTYYFGLNGLCLKIVTETPSLNQKVETYPYFKIIKTKWILTGWEVQMSINNKIETGFVVTLKNRLHNELWIPLEMSITVQQSKTPGQTFNDSIKFRNFLYNQPLQYIEQPK